MWEEMRRRARMPTGRRLQVCTERAGDEKPVLLRKKGFVISPPLLHDEMLDLPLSRRSEALDELAILVRCSLPGEVWLHQGSLA